MFKMKKSQILLLAAAALCLMLCACNNTASNVNATTAPETTAQAAESTVQAEESAAALTTTAVDAGTAVSAPESTAAENIVFEDYAGTEITVAANLSRVADLWPSHNQVMMLLGQADKLVVTTPATAGNAWVKHIFPQVAALPAFAANNASAEELMKHEPDLVFVSSATIAEDLRAVGINTAYVNHLSYEEMLATVKLTASIFGEEAEARAAAYEEYLNGNVKYVTDKLADVSEEEKPRVLYLNEYGVSYGAGTIVDEWIGKSGGVNAFAYDASAKPTVLTAEEILNMDPDHIFIISSKYAEIAEGEAYSGLSAIQNGNVHINPVGLFSWSQYGLETALQVLYVAQTLYPDLFADMDLQAEVQSFYSQFFDYELSAEEAQLILQALDPVNE